MKRFWEFVLYVAKLITSIAGVFEAAIGLFTMRKKQQEAAA